MEDPFAEHRAKREELVAKLTKAYVKALSFDELLFCRAYDFGSAFNQAYENARTELQQKAR